MISDVDLMAWIIAEPEDTDVLRRLERSAVTAIEQRTGRYYGPLATITENVQWRGWPMALANEPIGGVLTTFKSWDGSTLTTVDATTYYLQRSFIFWNSKTAPNRLTMPTRYQVTYSAGYAYIGQPDEWGAPEDVRQAVLLLVGHWYRNREGGQTEEIERALDSILSARTRVAV